MYSALKKTQKEHNNELQLTDGINKMMEQGERINRHNFRKKSWFYIEPPQNYFKAINYSFEKAIK